MEPGEKCIVREGRWYNAYGDTDFSVNTGMRLTVTKSIYVGGTRFYAFKETPEGNYYIHEGFTSMRSLN